LFNPFGVVWRFVRIRGFHPRLFKFNPVGLFNGINSFHRLWVVKIWVKESFFQGWVGVIAFSIRLVSVWSKGLSMTTAAWSRSGGFFEISRLAKTTIRHDGPPTAGIFFKKNCVFLKI